MQTVHLELNLNASAAFVFEQITDHSAYASFPGVKASELLQRGKDDTNGKGAVRRLDVGLFVFEEIIERYEPPTAMGYKITRSTPLPIKHKVGLVSIEPAEEHQCRVTWHSEFALAVPVLGWVLGPVLRQRITKGFAVILKTIEKRYQV